MAVFKNISNFRFGRLVAKEMVGRDRHKIALWRCQCDCGNESTVRLTSLTCNMTKSCGCFNSESRKKMMNGNKHAQTDGLSRHYLYMTWTTMKQRCYNPNAAKYYLYGARGIKVCDEWINSFKTFLEDMGDRPEGTTLNRVNNDGPYCKENCEWQTHSEQNRNRRRYKRNRGDYGCSNNH